jgi:DNA repair protein RecO (recombination protein O)
MGSDPSRTYQTEAIVIKRTRFGEADRLIIAFTPELGKVRAIAKGAMRPKSKLGGNVELLTYSLLQMARGRNLDIITQAQAIENFLPLRESLELTSYGFYICEMIDNFTEENVDDRGLFDLTLDTLRQMSDSGEGERALRYFELRLLDHLGYRPQLGRCTACGRQLAEEANYFSPLQGGVLCRDCGYPDMTASTLSVNALKVLRFWLQCDTSTAMRVKVDLELARELKGLLREYLKYILEKQLKSIEWLDRLTNGQTNV